MRFFCFGVLSPQKHRHHEKATRHPLRIVLSCAAGLTSEAHFVDQGDIPHGAIHAQRTVFLAKLLGDVKAKGIWRFCDHIRHEATLRDGQRGFARLGGLFEDGHDAFGEVVGFSVERVLEFALDLGFANEREVACGFKNAVLDRTHGDGVFLRRLCRGRTGGGWRGWRCGGWCRRRRSGGGGVRWGGTRRDRAGVGVGFEELVGSVTAPKGNKSNEAKAQSSNARRNDLHGILQRIDHGAIFIDRGVFRYVTCVFFLFD